MAHFAKITETNEVLTVLTLNNSDMLNSDGAEEESIGQTYLEQHNNWPAHLWIKTSYGTHRNIHNDGGTPFRGNFAGMGFTWDTVNNLFWPPAPFASWVKDIPNAQWVSPTTKPEYTEEMLSQNTALTHQWDISWNEATLSWDTTDGGIPGNNPE